MKKLKARNLLHKKIRRQLSSSAEAFLNDINSKKKNESIYFRFYLSLDSIIQPLISLTSIQGAAKELSVHENTIRNWIKKGKLKRDFYDSNRVELGAASKGSLAIQVMDEINEVLKQFRPKLDTDGRRLFYSLADDEGYRISQYQQVKKNEMLQIFGPALLWVRFADLLIEMSPDWDRLKRCSYCEEQRMFWDDSPNKMQRVCGDISCIRKRSAIAAKNSRVNKILEEENQKKSRGKHGK